MFLLATRCCCCRSCLNSIEIIIFHQYGNGNALDLLSMTSCSRHIQIQSRINNDEKLSKRNEAIVGRLSFQSTTDFFRQVLLISDLNLMTFYIGYSFLNSILCLNCGLDAIESDKLISTLICS